LRVYWRILGVYLPFSENFNILQKMIRFIRNKSSKYLIYSWNV